jgi:hypothetical protein
LKHDTHTTHTAKTRLNVEECFEQLVKEMKSWREKKNNNTSSVRRVSTLIHPFFWAAGAHSILVVQGGMAASPSSGKKSWGQKLNKMMEGKSCVLQ